MPDSISEVHARGGHRYYPRPRCPQCKKDTPLSDREKQALHAASWGGFLDVTAFCDEVSDPIAKMARAGATVSLCERGLYYVPNETAPWLLRLTEAGRRLVGV